MIGISKKIFSSLTELMLNIDVARTGDGVIVIEPDEENSKPALYLVADIGRKKVRLIRDEIRMKKEMKSEDYDLQEWLNGEFRENIMKLNHICIKKITLPTIMNVYGENKFDMESKGKQWEIFRSPKARIALLGDLSHPWWLRDAVSAAHFAFVYNRGYCFYCDASYPWVGVRPALILILRS